MERGIQSPLADLQYFIRHLVNAVGNRPSVHRLPRDRFQNQEIQSSLDEVGRSAKDAAAAMALSFLRHHTITTGMRIEQEKCDPIIPRARGLGPLASEVTIVHRGPR